MRIQADTQEKHIDELQRKIALLKERKTRFQESANIPESTFLPITPIRPPGAGDDWHTPGPARTLQFSDDLLLDEQVDLGDVSMVSMAPATVLSFPPSNPPEEDRIQDETIVADDDTVVLTKKVPVLPASPSPPPMPSFQVSKSPPPTPITPRTKLKINAEVERIVAKIWTLVPDLVKPGHGYGPTNNPPLAKETISYLQSVASLTPVPQSPTSSSTSTSQSSTSPAPPAPEQILTCYLLVSLFSCPSHFSMPLSELKALLAQKAGSDGSGPGGSLIGVLGGPQATNKILYNCVAKRLLAIDRSAGKQIVKFDV